MNIQESISDSSSSDEESLRIRKKGQKVDTGIVVKSPNTRLRMLVGQTVAKSDQYHISSQIAADMINGNLFPLENNPIDNRQVRQGNFNLWYRYT
jgi:hypothetical protein